MKIEQGFTLIELVAVLVILGILSATAIPKYMDMRSEAQIAALSGFKGVLKSANKIQHAKAVTQRQNKLEWGYLCMDKTNDAYNRDCVAAKRNWMQYGHMYANWVDSIRRTLGQTQNGNITWMASASVAPRIAGTLCATDWCVVDLLPTFRGYTKTTAETAAGTKLAYFYPKGYAYNENCGVYMMNPLNYESTKFGIITQAC